MKHFAYALIASTMVAAPLAAHAADAPEQERSDAQYSNRQAQHAAQEAQQDAKKDPLKQHEFESQARIIGQDAKMHEQNAGSASKH